jgi:chitin disaccharide deacetylase
LAAGFAAAARRQGFALNDGFAGFSPFDPARDYGRDFASYLKFPGRRHLVMCHPGHVDATLMRLDPVTATREGELAFLLSDRFTETLHSSRLALCRFAKIGPVGASAEPH